MLGILWSNISFFKPENLTLDIILYKQSFLFDTDALSSLIYFFNWKVSKHVSITQGIMGTDINTLPGPLFIFVLLVQQ